MLQIRSAFIVVLTAALTACANYPGVSGNAYVNGIATSASQVTLADGTDVWYIECSGWANSWRNCFIRSNYLCSKGSVLIEQQRCEGGDDSTRVAVMRCK